MNETSNKNYFISIEKSGKEIVGSLSENKNLCVSYASRLASLDYFDNIGVFLQDESNTKTSVYSHKKESKTSQKTINHEMVMCENVKDLLIFSSRKIITRVLEPVLEKTNQSALEAIFSESSYKSAKKQEVVVLNAIKKVASAQSKKFKTNEKGRYEELQKIFDDIPKFHELTNSLSPYAKILKEKGIEVLISSVKKNLSKNMHDVAIYYSFAKNISDTANFLAKLETVISFYRSDLSYVSKKYIDEITAEICDRDLIFNELKSFSLEKLNQLETIISLCNGDYKQTDKTPDYLSSLSKITKDDDMIETRKVFANFAQTIIRDVSPIVQESQEKDEQAFEKIVKQLCKKGILIGDGKLAEALVLKGQQVYGDKFGEQASTEETIIKLTKKFKLPITKADFFVGLSTTPKGEKYKKVIAKKLLSVVTSIRNIDDIVDNNSQKLFFIKRIRDFITDIEKTNISKTIKEQIILHIENVLLSKEVAYPVKTNRNFFEQTDDTSKENTELETLQETETKTGFIRSVFQKGEFIFHEGDIGDRAYIIVSGEVEIFKENGEEENILGVLSRGALFGEMAIIDDEPRMAAARATEQTKLTIIPKDAFREKLKKLETFDPVLRRMIDVFINRIRSNANNEN